MSNSWQNDISNVIRMNKYQQCINIMCIAHSTIKSLQCPLPPEVSSAVRVLTPPLAQSLVIKVWTISSSDWIIDRRFALVISVLRSQLKTGSTSSWNLVIYKELKQSTLHWHCIIFYNCIFVPALNEVKETELRLSVKISAMSSSSGYFHGSDVLIFISKCVS